jgi:signal transduction histidine kinase
LGPDDDATYGPSEVRNSPNRAGFFQHWQSLSLTAQFLIVAALIVCGSMAVLGEWLSSQIAANQLRSRAESGALYMEGFLARHIEEVDGKPSVSAKRQQELDELLIGTDLARRVEGFRIWDHDGTVLYSTDKSLIGKRLPSKDIEQAFSGTVVAQLEIGHDDDEAGAEHHSDRPLIEIYAPIYRPGTYDVIAVGELYEAAEEFVAQRSQAQRQTWAIVGATTLTIMGLLFLIVRRASSIISTQRMTLKTQLKNAQALADQNRILRKTADKARMDASKSNETLLNRIGSDLHDGPVQLLSLLILRLGSGSVSKEQEPRHTAPQAAELEPARLAGQVLTELRELSTGLVLPEIENLSLEAALRVAVERHEYATGSAVEANYSGLPERAAHPLKICLYRVIQEGLNNAFRHAAAREQRVIASADDSAITVIVSDAGAGSEQTTGATGRRHPLGLQGIRNRIEAFGGLMQVQQEPGAGTQLIVTVPLESNSV